MKFELNGLKFEIEGNEQAVREEFNAFKEFTQQLVAKINLSSTQLLDTKQEPLLLNHEKDSNDYPLLKDIVLLDLPQTEIEWMLIYAFYVSSFGKQAFTREAVISKYKDSGRYTDNRSKKFSENFKALFGKKFIKSKNETECLLLEEGKQKAVEILMSNESKSNSKHVSRSKDKSETKERQTTKVNTSDIKILKELNLRPDGKMSLKEYVSKFNIAAAEELYLVIVFYLKEILDTEKVTASHIFTSLLELDKKVPSHFKQVLINIRNRGSQHWLELSDLEDINYSIRGMNHIKHDINKTE